MTDISMVDNDDIKAEDSIGFSIKNKDREYFNDKDRRH